MTMTFETLSEAIEDLKAQLKVARAERRFDKAYWDMVYELESIKRQWKCLFHGPVHQPVYEGSYEGARAQFGCHAKKFVGGILDGRPSKWTRA